MFTVFLKCADVTLAIILFQFLVMLELLCFILIVCDAPYRSRDPNYVTITSISIRARERQDVAQRQTDRPSETGPFASVC